MTKIDIVRIARALTYARPYLLDSPCPTPFTRVNGPTSPEHMRWLAMRDTYNNCVEQMADMLQLNHSNFDRIEFMLIARYCHTPAA
jgi:hypothetical protein